MKKSNFDSERVKSAEKLIADDSFTPCPINDDDELFPNGIFMFNITKLLEHIEKNPNEIDLVKVEVADFSRSFSSIDESHVDSVEVSRPVILAEIAPGHYNLIDGNHRMEKARKMRTKSIFAYKLNVKQHLKFLTEKEAYLAYIEYWNRKVK